METSSFSPTAAISFGWETFKKNKMFWVIATFVVFMLSTSGDFNFSDSDSSETSSQTTVNTTQEVNTNSQSSTPSYEDMMMQEKNEAIPFIPEPIDDVLGISDQREKGNDALVVALIVLVVFVFFLPMIIMTVLISGGMQMGIVKFSLAAVRGSLPSYELMLSEINLGKSFRFLAASFLYMLLVVFGLILFIIPGIYFALKYGMVTYVIVDKNAGIGEAFSMSGQITKGNKWNLFTLGFLLVLINIAGFLALIYGLFASIPVSMIASAYAYDRLSKRA